MPSSPAKSLDQLAREFYENYVNATGGGGTTGGLTNTELRATPVPVGGTVSVGNFPATQPVSGTVALDTATLAALETITAIISGAIALDTATLAALETISVANFPASQAVTGTFFQTTQPVSGTVTVSNPTASPETGLAKDGTDITTPTAMPAGGLGIRGWLSAIWTKLNGSLAVTGTFFQATQPVSGTFFQTTQPVSLATAPSTPVTGTFFQAVQATKEARSATSVATSASITTASGTVLAANANRLGATVYNESGAILYLHLGAAASLTAYTLQVAIGGYFEVPHEFTGILTGITTAGTVVCRVVEVS